MIAKVHQQCPSVIEGLAIAVLDSGCCGMAGSFGFKQEHYDISQQVGDLVVLPSVREASRDCLIVADGFSCRQQIAQGTNRSALHTAEVIHMALQQNGELKRDGMYPEKEYLRHHQTLGTPRRVLPLLISGGFIALGLLALCSRGSNRFAINRR